MHFTDLAGEEAEILALVDDWLSTTPEIFEDDEDPAIFEEGEDPLEFLNDRDDLL